LQFLDGFKPSRILEIFVVCQEMAKNRSNPVTRLQSPAGERKKYDGFVLKRKKQENKKKKENRKEKKMLQTVSKKPPLNLSEY
jgi:hypothetical protein